MTEQSCLSCKEKIITHKNKANFCPYCGIALDSRHQKEPPYEIIKQIAKGGMGEIFLAYDAKCSRQIALKKVRCDLKDAMQLKNRFLKEARITGQLTHPSIMPIYTIHIDKESISYTMPYLEGKTLKQILRQAYKKMRLKEPMDPLTASIPSLTRIFLNVCHAIEYAHSKHILHRDIKPENIMIGKFGEVMLLDWGLARAIKPYRKEQKVQRSHKVVGTIHYMPPERIFGYPATEQSDIYSLGVILYQLLTLHFPFRRGELNETKKKLKKERWIEPSKIAPYREVPQMLSKITQKCLDPDVKARYKKVSDLIIDIENYLAGDSEWFEASMLSIQEKSDWEFQENILLIDQLAITKKPEPSNWATLMISQASFSDKVRLEAKLTFHADNNGVGFLLSVPEKEERKEPSEGYCLWLSKDGRAKLFRSNVLVFELEELPIKENHPVEVRIEKIENNIHLYLDNSHQFSYITHLPLTGTHVGLLFQDERFCLKELKISLKAHNVTVNCLAVPDAFLHHKDYEKALGEYRRIAAAFPGRTEGREARFRAGITLLEKAKNTANDQENFFDLAQREFETLHNTPGAPLEYLGKALVYKTLNEFEEELKCFELAFHRYPDHPMLSYLHEEMLYRLHSSARENRFSAYGFALLVLVYLKDLKESHNTNKLFDNLIHHSEKLPFLESSFKKNQNEISTSQDHSEKLIHALSFWLAKPFHLIERLKISQSEEEKEKIALLLILLGDHSQLKKLEIELPNQINTLISLLDSGIEEALKAFSKEDLRKENPAIFLFLLERAKELLLFDLIDKYTDKDQKEGLFIDVIKLYSYLFLQDIEKIEKLLFLYDETEFKQESSPLYFIYGAYLLLKQEKQKAVLHFTHLLPTRFPPSYQLACHYFVGRIQKSWFEEAFVFEKRRLYQDMALLAHLEHDKKLFKRFLQKAKECFIYG